MSFARPNADACEAALRRVLLSFNEQDVARKLRNARLLSEVEKLGERLAALSAHTDRLHLTKRQYEVLVAHRFHCGSTSERNARTSVLAVSPPPYTPVSPESNHVSAPIRNAEFGEEIDPRTDTLKNPDSSDICDDVIASASENPSMPPLTSDTFITLERRARQLRDRLLRDSWQGEASSTVPVCSSGVPQAEASGGLQSVAQDRVWPTGAPPVGGCHPVEPLLQYSEGAGPSGGCGGDDTLKGVASRWGTLEPEPTRHSELKRPDSLQQGVGHEVDRRHDGVVDPVGLGSRDLVTSQEWSDRQRTSATLREDQGIPSTGVGDGGVDVQEHTGFQLAANQPESLASSRCRRDDGQLSLSDDRPAPPPLQDGSSTERRLTADQVLSGLRELAQRSNRAQDDVTAAELSAGRDTSATVQPAAYSGTTSGHLSPDSDPYSDISSSKSSSSASDSVELELLPVVSVVPVAPPRRRKSSLTPTGFPPRESLTTGVRSADSIGVSSNIEGSTHGDVVGIAPNAAHLVSDLGIEAAETAAATSISDINAVSSGIAHGADSSGSDTPSLPRPQPRPSTLAPLKLRLDSDGSDSYHMSQEIDGAGDDDTDNDFWG